MAQGLDFSHIPQFIHSAYKLFQAGEYHVSRVCTDDVLLLMLDGTLHFSEDGRPVSVDKGEYYIQRHGLTQLGNRPSGGARYYYIHFRGAFCDGGLPLRGSWSLPDAHERFRRMDYLQTAGGSAVELLAELLPILAALKRGLRPTENQRIIHALSEQIAGDLRAPWPLSRMAALSGYSVNHLIEIFRRETGQTPHAFLTGLRLHAARLRLLDSDLPLTQIAEECGFGNYSNFYKAFVKAHRCAPDAWRRASGSTDGMQM